MTTFIIFHNAHFSVHLLIFNFYYDYPVANTVTVLNDLVVVAINASPLFAHSASVRPL